jgi:PAS domain S-box-containing protein
MHVIEAGDQEGAGVVAVANPRDESHLSRERLDLVLDAGGMGTWDWDLRADNIRWDERTAAIFGLRLEDFDGSLETFTTLVHPDDRTGLTTAIEQAIATRGEFRREYRVATPDGAVRWVSVRGRVLSAADGTPESMLGVIQDRTDTHSEQEKLARTLESMHEAFFSVDRDWRFTYVNARAEQVLQAPREDLLGGVLWKLFPAALDTTFQAHYERAMRERVPATFEARYEPLDVWVEVRAYPDADGIAVYFLDISERKLREQERGEEAERQEAAHEATARLLSAATLLRVEQPPKEMAATVCRVGREALAVTRVSIWEAQADTAVLLAQSGGQPIPLGSRVAVDGLVRLPEAMESGRPVFVPDSLAVDSVVQRELAARIGVRSVVQAPVDLGGGGTLVAIVSWDRVVQPPAEVWLDVVVRFAQQAALAVEQSRRRRAQIEAGKLSAQLQASLLPTSTLESTVVEVAALYQPGERRMLLGGDFYDVAEHVEGCISVLIGDVTGHGPEAAAIGATLRAGWRTLVLTGAAPEEIMPALDELLRSERTTDEQLVSIACAQISEGRLTLASAGHPPPLLISEQGTTPVEVSNGLLLGVLLDGDGWGVTHLDLPDRWALLLYTDGLPEARLSPGSSDRLGLDRFAEHVAATRPLVASGLDSALRRLQRDVRAQAGEPIEDDVALLLLRGLRTP